MEIITIISILLPYFIFIIWAFNLKKDNRKLRTEFFKKLSDSETQRDNLINGLIDNINSMVDILNNNRKGQDENWKRLEKYIKKNDELNKIQAQINVDNLEIFQEFDYIIQGLDKKVNTALDEQEKYSIKRDRYENRLTEVCKALDEIKYSFNKNVDITIGNFEVANGKFGIAQRNFDKTFKAFKQIEEGIESIESRIKRPDIEINTEALAHKVVQIDRTLNKVIQRQLQAKNLKEILENPIEVTRPSCETKLKLKDKTEEAGIEIINKVEFEWLNNKFEKGCVFTWKKGTVDVKLRSLTKSFREPFSKSLWMKVIEVNEPKPKRKYTKRK